MNWLDVAGPPGVGKSSLCDPLWGPHAIEWRNTPIPVDGAWGPFAAEINRLFEVYLRWHWSFEAADRMTSRSLRKMAAVAGMPPTALPYIQTGLVQRGLGYGWRLNELRVDLNELRPFFELMPVSIGVAFLEASSETIEKRNHARLQNPETAHENRAFMVPLMLPAIDIAKEVLRDRGVPVRTIDVEHQSIESARDELVRFASEESAGLAPDGRGGQVEVLQPSV